MTVDRTSIDGLLVLAAKSVTDERGTVREFYRTSAFAESDVRVPDRWAQLNLTYTKAGAIRGLHGEAADKLIGIASGEAFGAYLDARPGSATRGQVVTQRLTVGVQVLVPAGVCNGFQAVTDCQYLYCFGVEWTPGMAGVAVTPLDPDLGIEWPIADPVLSEKDASAPRFAEL